MTSIFVLGAGVNGLVAANLLARAGRTVTVLDSTAAIGAEARHDILVPGYVAPGILDRTERFSPTVAAALDLGAIPRGQGTMVLSVNPSGIGQLVPDGVGAEIGELAKDDRAAWRRHQEMHQRLAEVLRPLMESVPPSPLGQHSIGIGWIWKLARGYARLSRGERELLLRVPPAPLGDWLTEQFQSDAFCASLSWAGLEACFAAPASPGTAAVRMFHDVSDYGPVRGGAPKLLDILEGGCRSRGVSIRLGVKAKVIVSDGAVVAVDIDGERHKAAAVLSTLNPIHTLLDIVDGAQLAPSLERALRNVRQRGTTVRFDFALDNRFTLTDGNRPSRIRIAGGLKGIERAFDAAKYNVLPETPWMEVRIPSADPELSGFAPTDGDIVSVLVRYITASSVPNMDAVSTLRRSVVGHLNRLCPQFEECILAERYQGHESLAHEYGLTNGNLSHGEPGLDQLLSLRPIAQCGRFQTPIARLWLGGMGCHPGGGLTGLGGWLGANVVMQAL